MLGQAWFDTYVVDAEEYYMTKCGVKIQTQYVTERLDLRNGSQQS